MLLILAVCLVVAAFVYRQCINRLRGLPPGPPPLPFIGNLHQMETDMGEKFLKWKRQYGKVFTIWLPDPVIEQRRFALHSLRNQGFATSSMTGTVSGYGHEIVKRWSATNGAPFDPTPELTAAVGNVILNLVFGRNVPFDNPLLMKIREIMDVVNSTTIPSLALYEVVPILATIDEKLGRITARMTKCNGAMREVVNKELNEVAASMTMDDTPRCYAEALLHEASKREKEQGDPGDFSRPQLIAAIYDVWVAGFDKTIFTLRYALHYIMSTPEIQNKLQAEIDAVIGDRDVALEDQKKMPYLTAFLTEVQRIHAVLYINFFRQTDREVVIEGFKIPSGTTVLPQFHLVHHDPNEFESPDNLRPERHLNERGEFIKDPRITPFSMGKRACVGEGLARMELFLFLTTIVQNCEYHRRLRSLQP